MFYNTNLLANCYLCVPTAKTWHLLCAHVKYMVVCVTCDVLNTTNTNTNSNDNTNNTLINTYNTNNNNNNNIRGD